MNRILTNLPPQNPPRENNSDNGSKGPPAPRTTLLTTVEAAEFLRLSARTLERYRVDGTGPAYTKVGPSLRAKVVYRREDLEAWLDGFRYLSTSEYPQNS